MDVQQSFQRRGHAGGCRPDARRGGQAVIGTSLKLGSAFAVERAAGCQRVLLKRFDGNTCVFTDVLDRLDNGAQAGDCCREGRLDFEQARRVMFGVRPWLGVGVRVGVGVE